MTTAEACAQRSTEYPYVCNRPRGHDGAHIATDSKGHVLDTWCTPTADKKDKR